MRPLLLTITLVFLALPDIALAVGEKEKARLDTLREQRATLEKKLEESEHSRTESANRLRETEQAISSVGRKLRDLGTARAAAQHELGEHERELGQLERQQQARQAQLARLLRHQFRAREADALSVLLAGGDPNMAARDRHFLALLSQAKADLIASLRRDAGQIRQVSETVRARGEKLAELARHEETERAALRQRQQERQIVLAKIAAQIKTTQREIETLKQNEQRLAKLIDSLGKRSTKSKPGTKSAPPPRTAGKTPAAEPVNAGGDFARLRGKLLRPIDGTVTARFGSRRDDGQSIWKGLFFRAAEGASVKAVAAGVVVFADWLRGYGNLIIIDHDDDFLSVYGNNQTLLADVGQKVGAGGTVGTAGTGIGTGGGQVESGLYFELRHRGQPFDPGKWLK
jgi:septal ring factor EnvC (AmiA/AmiB activator)